MDTSYKTEALSRKNHNQFPFSIVFIAGLILLGAVIYMFDGLCIIDNIYEITELELARYKWKNVCNGGLISAYLRILYAGLLIIVFYGFIKAKRWAWVFMMFISTLNLFLLLCEWYFSVPNYLGMFINSSFVFILNLKIIKKHYGIGI